MTATHRPGPGSPAHENHGDLSDRLAGLCRSRGIAHRRKVAIGTNPFGGVYHCDLLLSGVPGYPNGLAVVARWKEGPGSADHKLTFLVECIIEVGVPTYIVLDGDGWREIVWEYLARKVSGPFLGALSVDDFAELLATAKRASW